MPELHVGQDPEKLISELEAQPPEFRAELEQLQDSVPLPAILVAPRVRLAEEVRREGERASLRHVEREQLGRVGDDHAAPADLGLPPPDVPPDDRVSGLPSRFWPSRA